MSTKSKNCELHKNKARINVCTYQYWETERCGRVHKRMLNWLGGGGVEVVERGGKKREEKRKTKLKFHVK